MEESIQLAIDTGINDVITGDLNLNMSNPQSARKIQSLSEQFSLRQCILLSIRHHLLTFLFLAVLVMHFLKQDARYHSHIYGIFNFAKPKTEIIHSTYLEI